MLNKENLEHLKLKETVANLQRRVDFSHDLLRKYDSDIENFNSKKDLISSLEKHAEELELLKLYEIALYIHKSNLHRFLLETVK